VDQINRSKITLRACLVGAYLFSVPAFAYSESLGLLIIPQITGALLVAYAVFDILRSLNIKIPFEIGLYGLMGLCAVLTFPFGARPGEWVTPSLGSLIKVVLATLACAQLIKDEADFLTALKIFVFSILFVYYQNMGDLQYLKMADQITETDRFAGTLANANTAAMFSLTVIWASVISFLVSKKGLFRWVLFPIPIGISLLIIYYSGSKKGLLGVGLFILFYTRLLYIRQYSSFRKKTLVMFISISLIIIAGYVIYTSPFFFRIEQLYYGGSDSDINRLHLASEAINVWLMNWKTFFIGVGHDNFRLFTFQQTYSHVTPLELLACNGIIGFFLFMGFFFFLFRKFIFLYRHAFNQELKSVLFSTLIFLFLYSFFMMTSVLHASRELMPILGCLAAFGHPYSMKILLFVVLFHLMWVGPFE
jgi:O-antigen ligase